MLTTFGGPQRRFGWAIYPGSFEFDIQLELFLIDRIMVDTGSERPTSIETFSHATEGEHFYGHPIPCMSRNAEISRFPDPCYGAASMFCSHMHSCGGFREFGLEITVGI